MKTILNKTLLLIIYCLLHNCVLAQDYLNDTALQKLDFFEMEAYGYMDTIDIMQGDYYDTFNDYPDPTAWKGESGSGHWCRRAYDFTTDREIDLRKHNQVYIKIFHDDFSTFDKNFWQSNNVGGGNNWHLHSNFNGGQDKAVYVNNMETVNDGHLLLNTRYQPKELPWNSSSNSYDPWSSNKKLIEYFSARVESAWAFDGSLDIKTPTDKDAVNWDDPLELTEDEGGIAIISKIKHPLDLHLWPAYWLMGYRENSYDEFDIFEYMIEKQADNDNIVTTLHSEYGSPSGGKFACEERTRNIPNPSGFHIYTHFWNAFNITTYCENKLIYCLHQFSKEKRRFKFPEILEKNKAYTIRKKYNRYPMRINFNTGIYPQMDNKNLNAWLDIDYIAVYKKFDCAGPKTYNQNNNPLIKNGVFNCEIATTATFDYPLSATNPVPDNQFFKLIANNTVNINALDVSQWATFQIEHTAEDLCTDQLPKIGDISTAPHTDKTTSGITSSMLNKLPSKAFKVTSTYQAFTIISENSNFTICLYEINGKLIKKKEAMGNGVVNLIKNADLKNGMYIIHAYNPEKKISETFKHLICHE